MLQTRSSILLVAQVNTIQGGSLVSIANSAGWIVAVSNTGGSVVVSNTQTSINIINSAGWIFAQSNTSPLVQVQNSAGWIFAQSNTGGNVNVANSAGWIVATIESGFPVAVITTVVSTVGLVTILASNPLRRGLSIYNQSTSPFYFKLGATATTASYTLMMVGSGYYELPKPVYTGQVTGLWASANGYALVTELTG